MNDGLAIGGPLDGKRITHQSPYYKVPELNKLKPYISMSETLSEAEEVVDVFAYEHLNTPGGDVWVPSEIMKCERYEHKFYDHPLDYVFSKLIRGYRPEGY